MITVDFGQDRPEGMRRSFNRRNSALPRRSRSAQASVCREHRYQGAMRCSTQSMSSARDLAHP